MDYGYLTCLTSGWRKKDNGKWRRAIDPPDTLVQPSGTNPQEHPAAEDSDLLLRQALPQPAVAAASRWVQTDAPGHSTHHPASAVVQRDP